MVLFERPCLCDVGIPDYPAGGLIAHLGESVSTAQEVPAPAVDSLPLAGVLFVWDARRTVHTQEVSLFQKSRVIMTSEILLGSHGIMELLKRQFRTKETHLAENASFIA